MRVLSQAFVLFAAAGLCLECFGQRTISEVDPAKRGWYGEFYNLDAYAKCKSRDRNPANVACEYLRLTRVEEPAYWPYPDVPKPKLPEAPNPPVYRKGMTSKQYFDALCKAEAGEFIYKVVENVDGVYQIRPRKVASWEALMDRYVMEDPYGYEQWEATKPETMFALPGRYKSFEKPLEERASERKAKLTIKYFQGEPDRQARYPIESIGNSVRSKHGFYWRGIVRPMDRELAIAGGELIVVELSTGEVLGVRRGFARSGFAKARSGVQWESAEICPRIRRTEGGFDKWPDFTFHFVSKVLKPANW